MKKIVFTGLLCALLAITGCVNTIKRMTDPEYHEQQNRIEFQTMFPSLQGFYAWANTELGPAINQGVAALPDNIRINRISFGEPRTRPGSWPAYAYIGASGFDYLDMTTKGEQLAHFKVQDSVMESFCNSSGYRFKKYKPAFTKNIINKLGGIYGLEMVRTEREYYGYSYVISDNENATAMIYSTYMYISQNGSTNWKTIFISTRDSEKIINSLPNSVLDDTEFTQ